MENKANVVNPTFYMVWCENGDSPKMKHTTISMAYGAAKSLANRNPGKVFHVMKSKGVAYKDVIGEDVLKVMQAKPRE